jgi:anti-anti-sigma factor
MDLKISERENSEKIRVIALKGRLDAHTADSIETYLNELIDRNNTRFIIDCRDITYLGSSGIRILISIMQKLKALNGKYAIINMMPSSLKILQAMEIERFFNVFKSESEAAAFLD